VLPKGLLGTPATAEAAGDLLVYRSPRGFGRGPGDNVRLNPGRDDDALPAARALVGHTIGSSGYSDRDALIFDANDAGTSCWFELTEQQASEVRATTEPVGPVAYPAVRHSVGSTTRHERAHGWAYAGATRLC
jgi:hypothetical protein